MRVLLNVIGLGVIFWAGYQVGWNRGDRHGFLRCFDAWQRSAAVMREFYRERRGG